MAEAIVFYQDLENEIAKYIDNEHDRELIHRAYLLALAAHEGQMRKSGEAYIHHPLAVALILAELKSSPAVICAGLLHDVIEDTTVTYDDLVDEFGEQIARVVQGVTKLEKVKVHVGEQTSANYQNLIFSMIDDVTVIFVKLADRLHNMRTLGIMREEKQRRIAKETLDILVPIAHRLGIYKVKSELEDLSLRVLDPDRYYDIVNRISERRESRVEKLDQMTDALNYILAQNDLRFEVKGRIKNIYSIYKKMYHKGKEFDEIYDLSALRILTDTVQNCYAILGHIHSEFTPLPSRIKDYIAMPKPNGYQSLHTTVLGPDGTIYEIQIRTYGMESIAEYGVAAHWTYKDNVSGNKINEAKQKEQIQLFQEIKNLMNETSEEDSTVFIDSLKSDVLSANIYVFTPNGDVFSLPTGSTPIDFAYRIHSKVGEKTSGAKVNDRIVPLGYTLKTGDVVEILTQSNGKPKEAWLRIAKTSSARSKIKQYFKKERREEYLDLGRERLLSVLDSKGFVMDDFQNHPNINELYEKYSAPTFDDLIVGIGNKTISA
ncbi:MAG: RelA/SpoT family protein, partial [Culicoidibacterales bacterium]